MKKIILNTTEADETSTDKKNYKYYFNKPIVVKEKSTLSLQSITDKEQGLIGSTTPTSTGLLHIGGLSPFVYQGTPSNYGWSWSGFKLIEMEIDLTNSAEAEVLASDGFTIRSDFTGGRLKVFIYEDNVSFSSPQTLMVIAEILDMGSGFEVGEYITIKKRISGLLYTGALQNPVFQVTSVKDSLIFQDGILLYQEPAGAFNSIPSGYAGEVSQTDANFTSANINLGQGLIIKLRTTFDNPSLIELDSILSGGYGYEIGDFIYINKASFLPSTSGTTFDLPIRLQVSSNNLSQPPTEVYNEGLLTIGKLEIDETTIPQSIYTSFTYVEEWTLDLNDTTKCNVYNSNGGASVGVDGELKFFTFKDYGTTGFPRTTKLGQVINSGKNYRIGDYIIVKETAFPSTHTAGVINMRINITGISTSEIVEYPKGTISGVIVDATYSGEAGSTTNFTHTPSTENGQNTDFVWGVGASIPNQVSPIELKQIVDGGYGFAVGDVFWVNKNDALPTTATGFFTPFKVEVSSITNTPTPPPPSADKGLRITAKNLLYDFGNITTSKVDTNILIYNKRNTIHGNRDEKMDYKICDIPPQVLMGMELFIETNTGAGLTNTDEIVLDLKIS